MSSKKDTPGTTTDGFSFIDFLKKINFVNVKQKNLSSADNKIVRKMNQSKTKVRDVKEKESSKTKLPNKKTNLESLITPSKKKSEFGLFNLQEIKDKEKGSVKFINFPYDKNRNKKAASSQHSNSSGERSKERKKIKENTVAANKINANNGNNNGTLNTLNSKHLSGKNINKKLNVLAPVTAPSSTDNSHLVNSLNNNQIINDFYEYLENCLEIIVEMQKTTQPRINTSIDLKF